MMVMDLRLNTTVLHSDVDNIRKNRDRIEGETEIRLMWEDNDGTETVQYIVRVVVYGRNLWVKGYYDQSGRRIDFAPKGEEHILNYSKDDTGCALTLEAVKKVLKILATASPTDFRMIKGNESARMAYVMCVFLVSEMIRNELLEQMLLLETRKQGQLNKMWKDYTLVYRNWAKVSQILYQVESGNNIPIIYAADVKSMFVRLEASRGRGELTQKVLDIYTQLLE